MGDFVLAKVCDSHMEADLLRAYLEMEDIEVMITSDDAGGMLPTLSPLSGVKIYVPQKDLLQARAIINAQR